jgi:hypothetical protein
LPAVNPDTPVALTLASYAGNYSGTFAGADSGTFYVSVGSNGVTTCSGTSVASGAIACNFTLTPSTPDTTTAAIQLGITGNGAVFSGSINYYTGVASGSWSTSTSGASGTFTGGRL